MQTPLERFLARILVDKQDHQSPKEQKRIRIVNDNARSMVQEELSFRSSNSSHSTCSVNKKSPHTPTLQKQITQVSRWESGSPMLTDSPMTSPPLSSGSRSSSSSSSRMMGPIEETATRSSTSRIRALPPSFSSSSPKVVEDVPPVIPPLSVSPLVESTSSTSRPPPPPPEAVAPRIEEDKQQDDAAVVVKTRIRDPRRRGGLEGRESSGDEAFSPTTKSRMSFHSYHSSAAATNAGMVLPTDKNADIWNLE